MNKFIIILFKERGNGILQRDVEFSLTLFETCELVPPTILKVCQLIIINWNDLKAYDKVKIKSEDSLYKYEF